MTSPPRPAPPSLAPSRRRFIGGVAAVALAGVARGRHAAAAAAANGHTPAQIAARDAANLAASVVRSRRRAAAYQPLDGGIVHFFGYGESLSGGFYGVPLLSTQQPYDNLMIGASTRALDNMWKEPNTCTSWVPLGTPDGEGIYAFEPMIATLASPYPMTSGETPGEGAVNALRRNYLQQMGLGSDSACRFVLTNCGLADQNIAQLSKGANPEIFNRLRDAANQVRQTALSMGLTYQVGGVLWTHGETDVAQSTSYAAYLGRLQQLQADFLTDIVQTIAGQPPGVTVPWFSDQPAPDHSHAPYHVHQALLDWSNTPGSDFYLAGPISQYPDHQIHLTANGYRWHGNQLGKAMTAVLLNSGDPAALYMTGATFQGTSVLVNLNVPVPPLIQADAYSQYVDTLYPALGFEVGDSKGLVPIVSAAIVGGATVQLILGRALYDNPGVQAGYNRALGTDWGTNICDSDATPADDVYVYTAGVQDPGEDIATWNGAPLIGKPYPLNNYLALSQVPLTPDVV